MISKCIEIGADDYLPKPFNPTILRARVSSELSKRSLRSMENEYCEKIEQEKKHSEALLRNILPPEIAMRLRKGETYSPASRNGGRPPPSSACNRASSREM
jgi:adenylate cyclase